MPSIIETSEVSHRSSGGDRNAQTCTEQSFARSFDFDEYLYEDSQLSREARLVERLIVLLADRLANVSWLR